MSGEDEEGADNDWRWAHLLWQRRGLRMEEFADMPRNVQLAYISSELLEMSRPSNSTDRLAKAFLKKK